MTIKSSKELVNDALKEIKTISHTEASKLHKDGSCNLIDIRDVRELEKEGRVEGSLHIPEECLNFGLIQTAHITNKEKSIHLKK